MKRQILSPLQYNMLRIVLTKRIFSQAEAAEYLQTTFTSMARRAYLQTHIDRNGDVEFAITTTAMAAMGQYESSDVHRSFQSNKLSIYLDRYVKRSQRTTTRSKQNEKVSSNANQSV